MQVIAKFEPNLKTERNLSKLPDQVVFGVAKNTLDLTISKEFIPRKSKDMLRSSEAGGVRGSNSQYYIGSFTDYASYVWKMPQSTNWTNKQSKSQWYAYTLKVYGKTILDNAVNKAWKDNMQ